MRRFFGERLRQKRKSLRISQTKLGKMVGVHYNHIGRYERGEAWPSVPVLIKLSEVLEVTMDALVHGEASMEKLRADFVAVEVGGPSRLQELATAAGALSAADQLVVVSLIEAFLLKVKIEEMTRK